jgi:polyisoprenoid-binding protein YceI
MTTYLCLALLLAIPLRAELADYTIQPGGTSRMELNVEKTGFFKGKKHVFTFEKYKGSLKFDAATPERSKVDLTIESPSVQCHDTWVSMKDLKSVMEWTLKEMLVVEKFPVMTFQSTAIRKRSDGTFDVDGMLTIRGMPKPVTLTAAWHENAGQLTLEGKSILRMTDWGMKPPSAALGAIGTKAEMPFQFTVVASR